MPRRKKIVKEKKVVGKTKRTALKIRARAIHPKQNHINWTESYSSFLLGIVVVIVVVLFVVSIVRQQNHVQQTSSLSIGPTATVAPSPTPGAVMNENGKTYYVVKENDSLWNIAVAMYKDGYKWTDIAKANNLANPSTIFTGNKLYIPNAPEPSELGQMLKQPTPTSISDAIVGKTYTVKKGDDLWSIAVRAYADGYKWTDIAKVNNLANPGLIFSGNVLQIPR